VTTTWVGWRGPSSANQENRLCSRTFAWWRALGSQRRRPGVAAGLLWGLFLATKLQSFFLPVALGLHWLWLFVAWKRGRRPAAPSFWPIVWMALLGPLVFFVSWPWMWHDTLRRLGGYLGFHLGHVHYNFEYLGTNYYHAPYPWHEPLGMLLYTAPVVLLALAAAGAVLLWRTRASRNDGRATGWLLFISGFVPISLFLRGSVPIFGETKHWLATMSFLALAAGVAVQAIAAGLAREFDLGARARAAVAAALVAVAAVPAAVETARSHPYGLSHYNALAGGAPGGADLGMNRQFWGVAARGVLPVLAAQAPASGTRPVYTHDAAPAWGLYLRQGLIPPSLPDAGHEGNGGIAGSRLAIVIHERHFNRHDYLIWQAYGTVRPIYVLRADGVPIVSVYRRP